MTIRLAVAAMGNPLDPKTWSRTPLNIIEAMRDHGVDVVPIDARLDSWQKAFSFLLQPGLGRSNYNRGPFGRKLASQQVSAGIRQKAIDAVLHMGSLSLPTDTDEGSYQGIKHYLYADYTWNLQRQNAVENRVNCSYWSSKVDQLEAASMRSVSHFFSTSHYVKEDWVQNYQLPANKITPVGTGLGVIKPYDGSKDYQNKKILFAAKGRFHDKGGPLVIEAFNLARKADPDIQLIIVGSDVKVNPAATENMDVMGFVPLEKLQQLFEECSLFVLPAANEPWGLVYLEALACGMPIVGMNKGAFPEFNSSGQHGWTLQSSSPSELAGIIVRAFESPKILREIGDRGRCFVNQNFDWKIVAKKIITQIKADM